ncbi:hypothetical protein D5086_033067 [Populus alba]|uniref:Uncharacterized protein n=1 Tax=Populus alba TaxID=43335 RepID=A0ACC4AFS2_POPAL
MGRGANLEEEVELFMAAREKVDASAKIVDRVKKPVSGVRILQDKFPTSLLDSVWNLCKMAVEGQVPDKLGGFSVWNLCNWQSKINGWNVSMAFLDKNSVSPAFCGFDDLYNERSACSRFSFVIDNGIALALCTNFSSSYDYGCSSCIEAISDFRDYQLRISNVSANDKKAKIVCGVAVLISVVAENLKNSAWIDDFYRCLPASDAFSKGHYYFF